MRLYIARTPLICSNHTGRIKCLIKQNAPYFGCTGHFVFIVRAPKTENAKKLTVPVLSVTAFSFSVVVQ